MVLHILNKDIKDIRKDLSTKESEIHNVIINGGSTNNKKMNTLKQQLRFLEGQLNSLVKIKEKIIKYYKNIDHSKIDLIEYKLNQMKGIKNEIK